MKRFRDLDLAFPQLKHEYAFGKLEPGDLAASPLRQFARWFEEALRRKTAKPNSMTLATANKTSRPSARIVLLKGFDSAGFVFYTHYRSRKAREILSNPRAALVFYWPEFERQVRIEGRVRKIPRRESESYFRGRSRAAQLGAWASDQSRTVDRRSTIEKKIASLDARYKNRIIPLPPFWGGFRLAPEQFEFWQGRKNRLNDRFRYRLVKSKWTIERLQP